MASCTTVSPTHEFLDRRPHIPADILHCTVLVAAAVVAGRSFHSLAVVKVLLEEVDSPNNLAACDRFSNLASIAK